MQIGQVLWVGGFNKNTNKYNRFGFIIDLENNKEVYFHINNVNRNSEIYQYYLENGELDDLQIFKSEHVCFEYKLDKENKQAVNIQLCKEIDWSKYDIKMMISILKHIKSQSLINEIILKYSHLAFENEEIINYLDISGKFDFYIYTLNKGNNNIEHIEKRLISLFEYAYSCKADLASYYDRLPIDIRMSGNFLQFLDPVNVCNKLWETEYHGLEYWEKFSVETKIKYIYRISYTYNDRNSLLDHIPKKLLDGLLFAETNELIQGLLYMQTVKYRGNNCMNFEKGHNLIQDYIIKEISMKGKVNLHEVSPKCHGDKRQYSKVNFCEGKLLKKNERMELCFYNFPDELTRNRLKANGFGWDSEKKVWYSDDNISNRNFILNLTGQQYNEKYITFCPRTRSTCDRSLLGQKFTDCWRNNPKKYWGFWNLQDFIEDIGVEPRIEGIFNPKEYVYRLNGWINKLEEITERLKCQKCRKVMVSNFKYSKKINAVYNNTVAKCADYNGDKTEHDGDTYFSHCSGCGRIIDSRESIIKQEKDNTGYYLCIHCGRGDKNHPTFKEGDKCPRCGELYMNKISYNIYVCRNLKCSHKIKIPSR